MSRLINIAGKSILFGIALLVLNSPVGAQSPTQTSEATISQNQGLAAKIKGTKAIILDGKIESIDQTTLTISKDGETYTVNTDRKTLFRRKFWGKGALSEMQAGDIVNVHGKWTDETQNTIKATLIRDLSIPKRHGVFFGTVDSVSANTLVITTEKRGKQTVTVSLATRLVNRKMQKIKLTDIAVGHRIRVKGLWDSVNNTITEVTQIKNFSIPALITPTKTN